MKNIYENPLIERYSSKKMQQIFSPDFKFSTWRRLWVALAESEKELGLPITEEQLSELREHITDIDYEKAAQYERSLRHDVMAHIRTYGEACPTAKAIIHLGATSCYVDDNGDIIQMDEALRLIRGELIGLIRALSVFAEKYADTPILAYTHFQAAQPTTLGKRASLWLENFMLDLRRLDFEAKELELPGCKGATGTAASFLELFEGDADKVHRLEELISKKMGYSKCMPVCGQTYSRKHDTFILNVLSGIAESASKMAVDLRLMAHEKEFDEPFEEKQVGSSAMAYKRNPMRCERICSLARYIINLTGNAPDTAANQWLERTLDDSANRRLTIPESFLAADAVLMLARNVISGCRVYPKVMERHINEELPYMATENIMMRAVSMGEDRQELHEAIRQYSVETTAHIKLEGGDNDLLGKLMGDSRFHLDDKALREVLDVRKFVGTAPEQTRLYLVNNVNPVLAANLNESCDGEEIRV